MEKKESIKLIGDVEIKIDYNDGRKQEKICFKNTVLNTGRNAFASILANEIGNDFDFYISRMLFGSNGTDSGSPKYVNSNRTGLFSGSPAANKPVSATIDGTSLNQVVFNTVLTFTEANTTLNEIALQMSNGDLYSMTTFADVNKTSAMQLTFSWRLTFV